MLLKHNPRVHFMNIPYNIQYAEAFEKEREMKKRHNRINVYDARKQQQQQQKRPEERTERIGLNEQM